jgi:hypothetical protein
MWRCADNQEVGLEAAILERVRNSSLVECRCADNPAGQRVVPKLRTVRVVGERRGRGEAAAEARRGASTSANAGTSNSEAGCEPPPPEA